MKAYITFRFIQHPDIVDLRANGRKSSLIRMRPRKKAQTRRYLKQRDKARIRRQEKNHE